MLADAPSLLRIAVAWSPKRGEASEVALELPFGATVEDALRSAGVDGTAAASPPTQQLGIWGRRCSAATLLRDGDRVEVYRPLEMSAGEARRRRAGQRQALKTTKPAPR